LPFAIASLLVTTPFKVGDGQNAGKSCKFHKKSSAQPDSLKQNEDFVVIQQHCSFGRQSKPNVWILKYNKLKLHWHYLLIW
jgi:hypothetical protein